MKKFSIGIDIGGTNTDIGLVNRQGECVSKAHLHTDAYSDAQLFVDALCREIVQLLSTHRVDEIDGIGIGAPNANFYTGCIDNAPNLQFKGNIPLKQMIENQIDTHVVLANDANIAAYGEMIYGGAKKMKNFIMITLGTGVGSGIVIDGKVVHGSDSLAGELGHSIVFPDGRLCNCGRRGCLEEYASSRGIRKTLYEFAAKNCYETALDLSAQRHIGCREIGDAVTAGDPLARAVHDYTGYVLGIACANAVTFSSPEAIFLMGGLLLSGDIITPTRKSFYENLLFVYKNRPKILLSHLNLNESAILGAAALAVAEQ